MSLTSISELTECTLDGQGAFDKLMKAGRVHLDHEYKEQRLRGPEYAQVYLGMMENAMSIGLSFMVQGAKLDLERQLLEQQVLLAEIEVQKMELEKQKTAAELELLQLQKPKLQAEVELMQAQVVQIEAENALIPKKALLMDAEVTSKQKQGELITAQVGLAEQQKLNAVVEGTVLVAQECKLRAEFDLTMVNVTKTTSENNLLSQRVITEKAQTQAIGVDPDSVIGRQKNLFQKQANGFDRDAEQKAAKLMLDTWSVRRSTDEATVADGTNLLNDATIGRFVQKLAAGVQA